MTSAKVIQDRIFFPYTLYLDSASHFCSELNRNENVSWHDLLAAIALLALSVEALANTIGELVVSDFKDFESSSPKAKIRIICESSGIEFKQNESPFIEVVNLLKVRNKIAHPKYQKLRHESKEMPLNQAQKYYSELGELLHDIEKALTPEMAQKHLTAVLELRKILKANISPKVLQSSSKRLVIDGEDICKSRP